MYYYTKKNNNIVIIILYIYINTLCQGYVIWGYVFNAMQLFIYLYIKKMFLKYQLFKNDNKRNFENN